MRDHGVAEGTEVRHVSLVGRLAAGELPAKRGPHQTFALTPSGIRPRWRLPGVAARRPALLLLGSRCRERAGIAQVVQVVSIQPSERWTSEMRNSSIRPLKGSATPLTRAQAFLEPEVLSRDLDRALDHPNQVGVHAVGPITRQLAETKGHSILPHQEGDHAGAGRGRRGGWGSPHERRQLVPWAQEAERIGVPAPHHGGGPG